VPPCSCWRFYAREDTTRGLHRAELLKINETVAALKKRLEAAHSTLSTAKQERDAHQELLKSVVDAAGWWKGYYASVGMEPEEGCLDPAEHIQQAENLVLIVEQIDLDSLDREQKRRIMQAIDVQVRMYPRNYVDQDGKAHERGELSFTDGSTWVSPTRWRPLCARSKQERQSPG
jgi:hypothetical protein